jgi:hypothetical protein
MISDLDEQIRQQHVAAHYPNPNPNPKPKGLHAIWSEDSHLLHRDKLLKARQYFRCNSHPNRHTVSNPSVFTVHLHLRTSLPTNKINEMISSVDLTLARPQGIRVYIKSHQCWETVRGRITFHTKEAIDSQGV